MKTYFRLEVQSSWERMVFTWRTAMDKGAFACFIDAGMQE